MTTTVTLDTGAQLDLLVQRYGQLRELVENKNKVIYQLFYLSVVFIGVVIGGYGTVRSTTDALPWFALFTSAVFVSMLLWTRTYINSRNEVHATIDAVYDEIEALDIELGSTRGEQLFRRRPKSDASARDWWERQGIKNTLLQLYYLVLSIVPLAVVLAS